uniref:N5-carboxyaminoimidazole ribonucleotide mutase n=1 Tax=Candidatus Kentrum sp. TUN TaxID=2126343 RepID=A0A450ZWE0_9GAMM|nr:MAG: 5-(carboxyamino)imidazole ribonucleotide mutase [Candidatus Kentron sp. TUN]VFK58119.1 MAG: 5-(carboxyamino)imidazole ribonucleotide mutase [Candidatus Kentron sp. TUN]VFK60508.1 MAG: 5-(carboxyamino)imidazole ribonucleotide mutase [Candidatus Kentron sp. TUN]
MNKEIPFVAIMMGSDSDFPTLEATKDVLRKLGVPFELKITSAHRTPEATHNYVREADARGCAVFIAAAGLAAHLAGSVAGLTCKPVIGIPINTGPLQGVDALLSTVQMPSGVPVATVAIGRTGAKNAGYLAAQIMGLSNPVLAERLWKVRNAAAETIRMKDAALHREG